MKRSLHCVLAASTGLLAAAAAPMMATAAPGGDGHGRAHVTTFQHRDEAKAYWTADRMRRAVPRDHVARGNAWIHAQEKAGKPTRKPGKPGSTTGTAVLETPKKTIGKVFFTLGGTDYVCSANSVVSANKSTVATAGHCANEGPGADATRFVFVPAYDNGAAPYGKWAAVSAYTPTEWSSQGDMNQDTAFVVMEHLNGATLGDTVGGTGVAFNQPRGLFYTSFGYPAASPYDGQKLYSCKGTATNDPIAYDSGRLSQGIPCSMTGGSSGGPWFIGSGYAGDASVQNSVNSYGYGILKNVMFGPYWGDTIKAVYDTASVAGV